MHSVVAQEIKFARLLAGNDKKVTDKVLKDLRRWLTARSQSTFAFTEADFLRLWKGLFYCMWMSDKPLIQEELAESLSKLVHCFSSMEVALLYTKCTLQTLSTEWFGIDRYRVDKFEMLVRKIIRQSLVMCKNQDWSMNWVKGFSKILEDLLLDKRSSLGLILHIIDVYMEEVAKISEGKISSGIVIELIRPFAIYMAGLSEESVLRLVMKHIFRYLIFQSDVGIDYLEKFKAWKEAGFPCGSIKDIQKIELSDGESVGDNDNEREIYENGNKGKKPLDPRAGHVDVDLPQIPFNAEEICNLLSHYKFHKSSTTKSRKQIVRLINEFRELSKGEMPVGVKEVHVPKKRKSSAFSKRATMNLLSFYSDLYSDSNKSQRKRKHIGDVDQENVSFEKINNIKVAKKNSKNQQFVNTNDSEVKYRAKRIKKSNVVNETKKHELQNNLQISNTKRKCKKLNRCLMSNNSFSVNDIDIQDIKNVDRSRYSTSNGWDISSANEILTLSNTSDSLEPVSKKQKRDTSNSIYTTVVSTEITAPKNNKTCPTKVGVKSPVKKDVETISKTEVKSTIKTEVKSPVNTKVKTPVKPEVKMHTTSSDTLPIIRLEKSLPNTEPKKKVKIVLQKNTAQHTSEYFRQLRQSPAIPYDANRKPKAGVLKPSYLPSPINPFYKRYSL